MTAGETGERHLVVVTLDHKQPPSIEFKTWNKRTTRKEKLDLNQEVVESELELAALIRDKFGDPDVLLDMELSGAAPFVIDVDGLQTRLSGDFYWLQVTDNSEIFDSRLIQSWAYEQTIRGLFVRNMVIMRDQEKSEADQAKIDLALKLAIQAFEKSMRD